MYIVITSIIQGPPGPYVSTDFYRSEEEGRSAFAAARDDVGIDCTTIILMKVDLDTLHPTVLDSFEGTDLDV